MRVSTFVAGVFGAALVAAAPIDEGKTPDLTITTEGCGTITLENGIGYGLVNDRKCYTHAERIIAFQIRAGYTCTFFEAPSSCDQSKGYRGWTGPSKVNFRNADVVVHGHKCWTTPQGAAVIESPVGSIVARTPEVMNTGMEPLFQESSAAVKGCGTAMLDDGTGVGYNIVSGTCFKSAPITKFWISQGCRCTFYSEPCDMTKLYIGFGGGTHGTVAGRGMRGYSCIDHPLDAAAVSAIIAPAIEARIESPVAKFPNDKATGLEPSFNDTPVTATVSAVIQDRKCGTMTIAYRNGETMAMVAYGNKCQNLHSLEVTAYEVFNGCTCSFFQSAGCDYTSAWFGMSGPRSGSLQGSQINGWKCTDGPL